MVSWPYHYEIENKHADWFFSCTFTAENGKKIGWRPRYRPEHILEAAQEEVELILRNLGD
jgi:hypothetical protein